MAEDQVSPQDMSPQGDVPVPVAEAPAQDAPAQLALPPARSPLPEHTLSAPITADDTEPVITVADADAPQAPSPDAAPSATIPATDPPQPQPDVQETDSARRIAAELMNLQRLQKETEQREREAAAAKAAAKAATEAANLKIAAQQREEIAAKLSAAEGISDVYDLLGISREDSENLSEDAQAARDRQIQKAYRLAIREVHPDRYALALQDNPALANQLDGLAKKINAAYENIGTAEARRQEADRYRYSRSSNQQTPGNRSASSNRGANTGPEAQRQNTRREAPTPEPTAQGPSTGNNSRPGQGYTWEPHEQWTASSSRRTRSTTPPPSGNARTTQPGSTRGTSSRQAAGPQRESSGAGSTAGATPPAERRYTRQPDSRQTAAAAQAAENTRRNAESCYPGFAALQNFAPYYRQALEQFYAAQSKAGVRVADIHPENSQQLRTAVDKLIAEPAVGQLLRVYADHRDAYKAALASDSRPATAIPAQDLDRLVQNLSAHTTPDGKFANLVTSLQSIFPQATQQTRDTFIQQEVARAEARHYLRNNGIQRASAAFQPLTERNLEFVAQERATAAKMRTVRTASNVTGVTVLLYGQLQDVQQAFAAEVRTVAEANLSLIADNRDFYQKYTQTAAKLYAALERIHGPERAREQVRALGWGISTQGMSNDPARMVAKIGKTGFFSRLPLIGNAESISEAAALAQQLVTEGTAYAQKHLAENSPDRAPDRAQRRRIEDLLAHPLESAPRVRSLDRAIKQERATLASPDGPQEAFRQRQMEEANSGKAPLVIRPDSRLGRALDELRYSIEYLQTTAPGVWRELQKTDTASMRAISAIADSSSSSLDRIPLTLSTPNFANELREETASVRATHAEQQTNLRSLRTQQAETHAARQKFQEAALGAEDTALQAVETLSTTASSTAEVDHWLDALQKQIQAILDKHPVKSAKANQATNDAVPFMRVFQDIGAQR